VIDDEGPCPGYHDALAELALGTLAGHERSDALEHVGHCSTCARELAELASIADDLLELAPVASPPVGFELRVVERARASGSATPARHPLRRRRHRRIGRRPASRLVAVAALVAAVVGAGAGVLASRAAPRPVPSTVAPPATLSALLVHRGRVVGDVHVSTGRTPWLFMTVDDHAAGARSWLVGCEVALSDGSTRRLGTFRLDAGRGSWGVALTAPAAAVRGALLVSENGTVLASARL
jgi:hypothetical protein